jgi:hypothetical protein
MFVSSEARLRGVQTEDCLYITATLYEEATNMCALALPTPVLAVPIQLLLPYEQEVLLQGTTAPSLDENASLNM